MIGNRMARDERGFTLIELMVTIVVFGIVSTIIVAFSVNIIRTFAKERLATDNTSSAALGINELSRVIRSGTEIEVQNQTLNNPVFVTATNEELVMYTFLSSDTQNPTPIKVRFWIDSNRVLQESRYNSYTINTSYWAFQTTAASTRAIARQITTPSASGPFIFTYLDSDGNPITAPVTGATALGSIAAVKVTLSVQADASGSVAPVVLQNTVSIPNLGLSRVAAG